MKIPTENLAGLTLFDLYQLTEALEALVNKSGLSEALADFVLDLQGQCAEALYTRPSQTPEEALLKLAKLGADDIGNGSIYGPDVLSDAGRFIKSIAA